MKSICKATSFTIAKLQEVRLTPLFFQRRFLPMWTAVSLGALADNMLRQSLIIGVAFGYVAMAGLDDAQDAIPLLGSFFALSMLVFAPMSGQVAEKFETAMLFRRIKCAEVALMAIAAIGFLVNNGWVLLGVLFCMGAQSAFFNPARLSAMPKYLAPQELVRGNGFINAGLYVSILLGLFLGGLLIAAENGRLIVAGLLFCASFCGFLAVLRAPPAAANAPELKIDFNPFTQTAAMLRLALKAPGVARPLIGAALFFYGSTLVTVLVPIYVKNALGAQDQVATLIMGLFAIGVGLGAMSAAALSKRKSGLGFSALGVGASAFGSLAVFVLTPAAAAAAPDGTIRMLTETGAGLALTGAFVFSAASMGFYVVPLQAATQRRAPAHESARILAVSMMTNAAGAILGSLSILVVTRGAADPATAFLLVAAIQAAVASYMAWRRTRVPHGLFDESLLAPVENSPAGALPERAGGV